MKRYIKASVGTMTLRNYANDNYDFLKDKRIIVTDMTPYDSNYPDDVPGVLFDGDIDNLLSTGDNIEDNYGDNYLITEDLDDAYVVSVDKSDPDYILIELGGRF
jgi:hypothetical protein